MRGSAIEHRATSACYISPKIARGESRGRVELGQMRSARYDAPYLVREGTSEKCLALHRSFSIVV